MHLLDATSSEDEFEQLLENLPEVQRIQANKRGWVGAYLLSRP